MQPPWNAEKPLDPHAFRAAGHAFVDFIADYWQSLDAHPGAHAVLSRAQPGDVLRALPPAAPEAPDADTNALLHDLRTIILPALTHWQHPHFYAYFPANISGPSVLAELVSAGLGVQGMLWATSPACTELETRMLDWLGQLMQLPREFLSTSQTGGGVIQGTASDAALVALVAARERARAQSPAHLVVYCSSQAHSSITKAAMIAGIASGPQDRVHVRALDVDAALRLRPDALEAALREDLAQGRTPCMVCATVGTTGTTAIDPVREVANVLSRVFDDGPRGSRPKPWLHVDAAHAGAACICPEFRPWLDGVEHADSLCMNPHKWLLTNFDCDCFWTRSRSELLRALSITPEYLRTSASDAKAVIDYRDWQVPLGRRFRALKLWFVMRSFGAAGLRDHIRRHVRIAQRLEQLIASDPRFELAAPRTMNLVCFRLRTHDITTAAANALNQALLESVNASGTIMLSHTTVPNPNANPSPTTSLPLYTLRMAVGGVLTSQAHVEAAWALLQQHTAKLLAP